MGAHAMNPYDSPQELSQEPPRTSGMAIASLVLGILSFLFTILAGIPAIILGILALRKIERNRATLAGSGLAIAGITTGAVGSIMIGGCVALLLPAVQAARESARMSVTLGHMQQLGLALLNHHDEHQAFPVVGVDAAGVGPQLSWRVHVLPYLEEQALYEQFHRDEPWDSPHNKTLIDKMPELFHSPSASGLPQGYTLYQAVTGPETAFSSGRRGPIFRDMLDVSSGGLLLVEVDEDRAVPWTKPDDWEYDPSDPQAGLGGVHPGGWLAGFADGSVHVIPVDIDDNQVRAMVTSDAGD